MFHLLILILAVSSASCGHWGYDGAGSDWSKEAKECKVGRAQSPIDVNTKSVIYDRKLNVNFNNFDKPIDGEHLMLQNNGHTVQVTLDRDALKGRVPSVNGSAVGNENFEFVQLHFHWDEEDDMGSEHAIDGIRYALEMHYVLANTKYGADVSKATGHPDGLVVLATIFHASEKNDTYLEPLIEGLGKVKEEGANTTLAGHKVLLDHMLPDERDLFFKYEGSLTTPPCAQSVTWILYRDISAINPKQLKAFRDLTKHDENDNVVKIGHNAREIQLSHGRKVYGSVGKSGSGFLGRVKELFGVHEPAIKLM